MTCCNQNSEPNDQCFKINQASQNNDSSWTDENICVTASLIGLISEKLRSHFDRPIGIDLNKFFFCNIKNLPYLNTNYPKIGDAPYQIQLWLSNIYASNVLLGNSHKLDFPLLCNATCEPQIFNKCLSFDSSCCASDYCSLSLDLSPVLAQSNTANSRTIKDVMNIVDKYGSVQISIAVSNHLHNFYSLYSTITYNDDPVYFVDKPSMFLNFDSNSLFPGHVLVLLGYECGSGYVDFIVQDSFANNYVSFKNSNYKWRIRVLCDTYGDLAPFTLGVIYGNNNIVSFKINNLNSISNQLQYCCDNVSLPAIPDLAERNRNKNRCKDKNKNVGIFMSRGSNAIPEFLGCNNKEKAEPNIFVSTNANELNINTRHLSRDLAGSGPIPSASPIVSPHALFLCGAAECADLDGRKGLKLQANPIPSSSPFDIGDWCECIWPCGEGYTPYYCDRPDGDRNIGCEKCTEGQYLSLCFNGFRHCCDIGYFWKQSENRCVQCNRENAPAGCEFERVNVLRHCQCCQTGYKFGVFGDDKIGCYCESVYDPDSATYFPGEQCVSPRTMDLDTCRCECPSGQVWYNNACVPIEQRCPEFDSEGYVIGPVNMEGDGLYRRWDPIDLECQCEKGNIDVNDCSQYDKFLNTNTCQCDCPNNSSRFIPSNYDFETGNYDALGCHCDGETVVARSDTDFNNFHRLPCASCEQLHGQFSYYDSYENETGLRESGRCLCMEGYRYERDIDADDLRRRRCISCFQYDENAVFNPDIGYCDCAPGFRRESLYDPIILGDWTCVPDPSPTPSPTDSPEPSPSDPTPSPSESSEP